MHLRPNNFMAMNGAAPGILGSADSGTDVVAQLQRAAVEFANQYKNGADDLQQAKRDVIGKVMVAMTLDAITEEKADELTEAIMQLTKGKN